MVLEKTLESPSDSRRSNQSILKEINPAYSLEGPMLKLKLQSLDHLMWRAGLLEKTLMLGGIGGRRRGGTTEDEMVGWHHRLNGRGFAQTPGDGEGQGSLVCCGPRECRVRHDWLTEQNQILQGWTTSVLFTTVSSLLMWCLAQGTEGGRWFLLIGHLVVWSDSHQNYNQEKEVGWHSEIDFFWFKE